MAWLLFRTRIEMMRRSILLGMFPSVVNTPNSLIWDGLDWQIFFPLSVVRWSPEPLALSWTNARVQTTWLLDFGRRTWVVVRLGLKFTRFDRLEGWGKDEGYLSCAGGWGEADGWFQSQERRRYHHRDVRHGDRTLTGKIMSKLSL